MVRGLGPLFCDFMYTFMGFQGQGGLKGAFLGPFWNCPILYSLRRERVCALCRPARESQLSPLSGGEELKEGVLR